MGLRKAVSRALRLVVDIVLDLDTTSVPQDQINALNDILARHRFSMTAKNLEELVHLLKKKHMVDEICVAQKNGSLVVSSDGNGVSQAITSSALFNYVQSEIPKTDFVLIKNHGWNMLFSFGGKIYVVKAPASLTTIELKAISREIEDFLEKKTLEKSSQPKTEKQSADNFLIK
jgi:hypothetical protein